LLSNSSWVAICKSSPSSLVPKTLFVNVAKISAKYWLLQKFCLIGFAPIKRPPHLGQGSILQIFGQIAFLSIFCCYTAKVTVFCRIIKAFKSIIIVKKTFVAAALMSPFQYTNNKYEVILYTTALLCFPKT
jgi:hypothetical protein